MPAGAEVTVSNPPPARFGAVMATLEHELVLFGGGTGRAVDGPLDDTWTFDGTRWTEVHLSNPPRGRGAAMMATLGNVVVLF
ncbi:MAG: hypothetical protein JOZ69_11710, partial [Myxococcales bacterium]|nr:hypothetical protein [Myxococcales bacterium]